MNVKAITSLIKSYVTSMAKAPDFDMKQKFITAACNLVTNVTGVFIAHMLIDCDCPPCRQSAEDYLDKTMDRIRNQTILSINDNLECAGKKELYEIAPETDINETTHDEIMKEIANEHKKEN